jgi:hypothetical protein
LMFVCFRKHLKMPVLVQLRPAKQLCHINISIHCWYLDQCCLEWEMCQTKCVR